MGSKADSDIDDDLNYTPRISSPGNYRRFLDMSGASSLSDDEAGHSSGNEGYIDDDLVPSKGVCVAMLWKNYYF